jgi:hypothetical protein
MKRSLFFSCAVVLLSVTQALPTLLVPPAAVAQARKRFKLPKVPKRGAPSTSSAGASRTDVPLAALVPSEDGLVGGYTSSEQPILWFYNPYISTPSNPQTQSKLVDLKLILNDADDRLIDSMNVPLPETPGPLGIRFNSTKLKPDQPYRWILRATVIEPSTEVEKMLTLNGWVQREVPKQTLANALKTADKPQQFQLYRQNELWFDALTVLAEMRSLKPEDKTLQAQWRELLKDAGVTQQVIDCSLGNSLDSCQKQPVQALF